jgi:hypothetical protein
MFDVDFLLDWAQALLVSAVPLAVAVWGAVTAFKPLLTKIGEFIKDADLRDKVMTAVYMVVAALIGFGASAYLQLEPLQIFNAPLWAGYLVMAFLVALGENILHQGISILVAVKDWLRALPKE